MRRRKTLTLILTLAILICGVGGFDSGANLPGYHPLTLGSWWEYEIAPSNPLNGSGEPSCLTRYNPPPNVTYARS